MNMILNTQDYQKLSDILLKLGKTLFLAGGDIARVEDTITHIAYSYNVDKIEVFAITSFIEITIQKGNLVYSQSIRIKDKPSNNYELVEAINNLSYSLKNKLIPIEDLQAKVEQFSQAKINERKIIIGYLIAAISFCFFNGSLLDSLFAGALAVIMYFINKLLFKYCPNQTFYVFLMSFLNGLSIYFSCLIFPFLDSKNILISNMFLLIPGVSITLAFQNILVGDTTSGINQFIESLLYALAIAFGYCLSMLMVAII